MRASVLQQAIVAGHASLTQGANLHERLGLQEGADADLLPQATRRGHLDHPPNGNRASSGQSAGVLECTSVTKPAGSQLGSVDATPSECDNNLLKTGK